MTDVHPLTKAQFLFRSPVQYVRIVDKPDTSVLEVQVPMCNEYIIVPKQSELVIRIRNHGDSYSVDSERDWDELRPKAKHPCPKCNNAVLSLLQPATVQIDKRTTLIVGTHCLHCKHTWLHDHGQL